jgi:hypothetical protein
VVRSQAREGNLMASTDWTRARRAATRGREPGIPGDAYVVELRGHAYYVIDVDTRGISAGPFSSREEAQRRGDALNQSLGRSRRRG